MLCLVMIHRNIFFIDCKNFIFYLLLSLLVEIADLDLFGRENPRDELSVQSSQLLSPVMVKRMLNRF